MEELATDPDAQPISFLCRPREDEGTARLPASWHWRSHLGSPSPAGRSRSRSRLRVPPTARSARSSKPLTTKRGSTGGKGEETLRTDTSNSATTTTTSTEGRGRSTIPS